MVLALAMLAAAGCVGFNKPEGWAGPAAGDGFLVVSTAKGKLSALRPDDFSAVWTFPTGEEEPKIDLEAIYGTPVVSGDAVYFAGYSGDVYALGLSDGDVLWRFDADAPVIAGLAVGEATLYVAADDGTLYALDRQGGSELRRFDAGDSIWAAPLLAEGVLYIASVDGVLWALDAETFDPAWEEPFRTGHGLISDPRLADGTVLVGGIDRRLHAVDAATGQERWSFKGDNWFWGRPLVQDNTVYAPNLDGRLYALTLEDGSPLWGAPFQAEEPLRSGPVLAGDTLVAADRQGNVYGLDAGTGEPKWLPEALGKKVLSNLFLVEQGDSEVIISAEGGDLCRLDPSAGRLIGVCQ